MVKSKSNQINSIKCLICYTDIEQEKYIIASTKYNGEISCKDCGSLLHIKKIGSEIQEYRVVKERQNNVSKAMENLGKLLAAAKQKD